MTELMKYETIRDQIRRRIENGELPPGSRLKTELEMAAEYGVSAITVRRALADLVACGQVVRRRGAGTFVAPESAPEPETRTMHRHIAMLLTQESYSVGSLVRIMAGAQQTLTHHGSTMLIDWNSRNPKVSADSIRRMLNQGTDGFLIYPYDPAQNREEFQLIREAGKPYVLLDRRDAYLPSLYVGSNNFDGGIIAANALLELGHKKICFQGNLFFLSSEQERYAGFCFALRAAGIRPGPRHLMEKPDFEALAQSIRAGEITAVFCVSDRIAERAVAALMHMGIRVPEDVSIIGFDDNIYRAGCPVPLSTVRQNFELIGQRAAELILWALDRENDPVECTQIQTGVELVLRASTRKI
ncbi:MAG: GntR family transcriptional regulator [Clostridia bacterium]|nr:GntR family transcriptional regulator [Clostridia bacterium]